MDEMSDDGALGYLAVLFLTLLTMEDADDRRFDDLADWGVRGAGAHEPARRTAAQQYAGVCERLFAYDEVGALNGPDAAHPQVDPLNLLARIVGQVVAVESSMLGRERLGHVSDQLQRDGTVGHLHPDLESLAVVADVRGPHEPPLLERKALASQCRVGLLP